MRNRIHIPEGHKVYNVQTVTTDVESENIYVENQVIFVDNNDCRKINIPNTPNPKTMVYIESIVDEHETLDYCDFTIKTPRRYAQSYGPFFGHDVELVTYPATELGERIYGG